MTASDQSAKIPNVQMFDRRARKRDHLHAVQTRLSALEQENRDLVHQIAVRNAELKQYREERGIIAGTVSTVHCCCNQPQLACLICHCAHSQQERIC